MKFKKFSEWVSVKEQIQVAPQGNPPSDRESDALVQQIAGLKGSSRAAKLKQMAGQIASNKTMDPKKRAAQLAIVSAASGES